MIVTPTHLLTDTFFYAIGNSPAVKQVGNNITIRPRHSPPARAHG